jgi:hypothetical protein
VYFDLERRALSGEIGIARRRSADAVCAFEDAGRRQDELNFNEPPDWLIISAATTWLAAPPRPSIALTA